MTFAEEGGKTLVTFSEVYPTREALDQSMGALDGTPEQFEQLDELLATLGANRGRQARGRPYRRVTEPTARYASAGSGVMVAKYSSTTRRVLR